MHDKVTSTSNSTSVALEQSGSGQFNNPRDGMTRWVSYCALLVSVLTFVFGNNIAGRLDGIFVSQQENKTIIEAIIALLNVALAIFVLVDLWSLHPVELSDDNSPSSISYKQLLRGWQLLWFTWIPFYSCLAAQWFHLIGDDKSSLLWYITNGLNMINGFFFYYLFFVLDQPSVATESEPNRAKAFHRNVTVTVLLGFIVFVVSAFGEQNLQKGVLVQKLVPAYIAVGMAFFFGRLDSHYLRVNRVLLAPLYLYAVIQLFWGRDKLDHASNFNPEQVTIFSLALILKFAIFMTLSKWIRDGRFRQYFVVAKAGLDREL